MKKNIIQLNHTLFSALKFMDEIKHKVLFIVDDNNKFIGVLSLGDIQRAIINQKPLETPIEEVLRKYITVASTKDSFDKVRKIMIEMRTEAMPIIDENGYLSRVVYWDEIIDDKKSTIYNKIEAPVVIMAGGQGTRLKPLTNVLPKPLIPIGEKTIIEEIMDDFLKYDCNNFYISVNYRAEIIKYYLENHCTSNYNLKFFEETKPLGTAGSLNLLKNQINETFFVTNCDILIEQDYSEVLKYHKENENELTVVAALKTFSIPYGTIETAQDGILESITEKPKLTYKINTGFYILEPHLIDEIPADTFYHITHLIEKLHKENRRVGVFPISENSWKDIGEWKEYLSLINE